MLSKVQSFNRVKKFGLWMITVLVIFWYGNGNQMDSNAKAKRMDVNGFMPLYVKFINR
jgi:hypothetical protein